MEIELLLSFIGASVLLTLMPGPDNIFVLVESITKGSRNAILISVGLVSGILIHTLLASTGLSIVIEKSLVVFQAIKYLGAAYLLYLAYLAFGEKQQSVIFENEKGVPKESDFALIRKGFVMNVLNPKVSLFFIAFLPQFISENGLNPAIQMMVLGFAFMIQALIIFTFISLGSGVLGKYFKSSKFWTATKFVKIGTFTVLGLLLAFAKK